MTASALVEATEKLEAAFSGKILAPGDPDYDGSRRIHNGLIDKRPALIARARQLSDQIRYSQRGGVPPL